MRAALMDNDRVVNVVILPDDFEESDWDGYSVRPLSNEQVGPGWVYDGETFVAPEPPEPDFKEAEQTATTLATRLLISEKVKGDSYSQETLSTLAPLFPELSLDGMEVAAGEVYRWNHELVEVIQGHTTQSDWIPESTPALFKLYYDVEAGPQPWTQPAGAHDAYSAGAVVTHNGQTWVNTHGDGNVWEPGVYGWIVQ